MYAIFASGGKQHQVEVGSILDVEKLEVPTGDVVSFTDVLLAGGNEGATQVGTPYIDGASVVGEVVDQIKGPKIVVFKYKRRKGYRRKIGHRQQYTRLKITDIQV
ncbi:MAG: 50S ribosomal protein L21 [Candidatus Poribacteria bacterium]|jgi:large subunit ribosomal protein L21|nr:50S ribosomal protein L21 [Candidatus Poribacteria bacterium]MDP6745729.1 50S ribosomal protein L21 [Candidatus Poribacteria bacterium]MDP6996093.1 50S ribosomal protein L21 [Candidatus Poribacteria bacterium]MDP7280035.1 50S ribosomal protein L21 [Candidatus Poribacteria bacterium]